jgi:hypothetical protein
LKTLLLAAVAASTLLVASSASAVVVGDFQLNNSLANGVANGVTLSNNGGSLGATGIEFGANNGPTITGLGTLTEYTLETRFSLADVTGYRKLADFSDRVLDTGLYALSGGLAFYNIALSNNVTLVANTPVIATLSRTNAGQLTGYVNGVQQFSVFDSGNLAVINNTLHLFRDDFLTDQREASAGFVDYVTINSEAFRGGAVPEPATWAMLILGFGAAGSMIRRRKAVFA